MNRLFLYCMILFALAASSFFWGCAGRKVAQKSIVVPRNLEKILVVAFRDMNAGKGDQINVRCPLSGKVFASGPVDPEASPFLTQKLMSILAAEPQRDFKLLTVQELWNIQSGLSDDGQDIPERRLMVETGKILEADAVLTGHIYRYVERIGGNLSVQSPASVAFDIHLVRVSDGRVLWTGYFDETQKTLMEDMFDISSFFERDGKWVTAEQMASVGLEKIMETFKIQ